MPNDAHMPLGRQGRLHPQDPTPAPTETLGQLLTPRAAPRRTPDDRARSTCAPVSTPWSTACATAVTSVRWHGTHTVERGRPLGGPALRTLRRPHPRAPAPPRSGSGGGTMGCVRRAGGSISQTRPSPSRPRPMPRPTRSSRSRCSALRHGVVRPAAGPPRRRPGRASPARAGQWVRRHPRPRRLIPLRPGISLCSVVRWRTHTVLKIEGKCSR